MMSHMLCTYTIDAVVVFYVLFFFFFQAEDGIRDLTVTGVQTCALPISGEPGADDPDPHAHSWDRHETVSLPTRTASNVASTAMWVEVSVSVPVPRAASATALSARVTQTVPLSSGAPCAASPIMNHTPSVAPRGDSVSPRCSRGQAPMVIEAVGRRHPTMPV